MSTPWLDALFIWALLAIFFHVIGLLGVYTSRISNVHGGGKDAARFALFGWAWPVVFVGVLGYGAWLLLVALRDGVRYLWREAF